MENSAKSGMSDLSLLSSSSGDWFAIKVKAKCERCVAAGLDGRGYKHFLPLYQEYRKWAKRLRKVERTLIPGYVFAQFDSGKRLPVLTIPGVSHVVGTSRGPLPISRDELAALELIVRSGSFAETWHAAVAGQQVVVAAGPLRGLRGCLVEVKNQTRVVVSITLLSRSVAAEVDRHCIQVESSPAPTGAPVLTDGGPLKQGEFASATDALSSARAASNRG